MKLEDIKGMGKSRISKLQAAGINTPLDLLLRFPYKYVEIGKKSEISRLADGDELTVCGVIDNEPRVQYIRKGLNLIKVVLKTEYYGVIDVSWFNRKFLVQSLKKGKEIFVTGKVKRFRNKISLSAPILFDPGGKKVLPLYRSVSGVPQSVLDEAVDTLLTKTDIKGYVPQSICVRHGLLPLNEAFSEVHRPHSIESAHAAMRTLVLEKLSYNLAVFDSVRSRKGKNRKFAYNSDGEQFQKAIESLPFTLTESQRTALEEIVSALKSASVMNRLLQGDVGCGKTVVALLSAYYAYLSGYQSVLMAPTEILAIQHYKSAIEYLEPLGVKVALLCGSLPKAERDEVLFNIRTHTVDVVIGTHALLSDDVTFSELALIITDEQQRFGVNQRSRLENKSLGADTLVMTATPIPRTLALCMYGELEQSCISSLPSGRAEISTSLVPESKFDGMYRYIAERAKLGEQAYIVCPRIDCEEEDLVSATGVYDELSARFGDLGVGLLHGRQKDAEKAAVMNSFARGEVKILVATTVVEVGIDVPSAANMVIFNPERYGLSQLHQLRGRVGRGNVKSYCFLPVTGSADERLKFFCECRDGFALSEYDFRMRGAGDFIGTRQHGDTDGLAVKIDAEVISEAKRISEDLLSDAEASRKIEESVTAGTEQYVSSITMN